MVRDAKGRFVKGHSGNPNGRPKMIGTYIEAMQNITPDDWLEVVNKAFEQAKRGDSAARKFLADYLLGLPTQSIDMKMSGQVGLVWDWTKPEASQK